jgi:hypothetical protein
VSELRAMLCFVALAISACASAGDDAVRATTQRSAGAGDCAAGSSPRRPAKTTLYQGVGGTWKKETFLWEQYACGETALRPLSTALANVEAPCPGLKDFECFGSKWDQRWEVLLAIPRQLTSVSAAWKVGDMQFQSRPLGAGQQSDALVFIEARRVAGNSVPPYQTFIYSGHLGILVATIYDESGGVLTVQVPSEGIGIFAVP